MKGISAVIATLLLLVITIGLATTVYFYVNNIASRQTSKVVEVQGYCSVQGTTRTITLVITNLGTDPIVDNLDLKYILNNGNPTTIDFQPPQDGNLDPRATKTYAFSTNVLAGANNVVVLSPSGPIRMSIFC